MNDSIFGSHVSCFPFGNESDGLNIVSGVRAVADSILYILLLQKGEDPCYPDIGMSPAMFAPMNDDSVYAFRYKAQKTLEYWNQKANIGFKQIWVDTTTVDGRISLKVTFTVDFNAYGNVLTFGYWQLINAVSEKNVQGLLETVQLS